MVSFVMQCDCDSGRRDEMPHSVAGRSAGAGRAVGAVVRDGVVLEGAHAGGVSRLRVHEQPHVVVEARLVGAQTDQRVIGVLARHEADAETGSDCRGQGEYAEAIEARGGVANFVATLLPGV